MFEPAKFLSMNLLITYIESIINELKQRTASHSTKRQIGPISLYLGSAYSIVHNTRYTDVTTHEQRVSFGGRCRLVDFFFE